MSPAPATEPRPASSEDFAAFLRAAVAADRKQPVHECLRHRLLARLWESGEPEEGSTADIIFTGPDGTHLFEVLQAERPAYADLREAATRIAEVRYTLGRSIDRVFLVCAAAPAEHWAVEAVEGAFGASVVWWEDGTWHGLDKTM
ncbi:hypothetical protein [Streptomyces mangrovi]|uniref:hypothetical protein n=1 Tax=Streptomyces mangrovi TaxID=1206892 RepID=UPI00399CB58B